MSFCGTVVVMSLLYCIATPLSLKSLKLLKWKDTLGCEQTFSLESKVASQWRACGILLGLTPSQLDAWDEQYRGNASTCWTKVMEYWLTTHCDEGMLQS